MACLKLAELRELAGAEKAFLDDTAKRIEDVVAKAKNSALYSGLDPEMMQQGLITTLIVTTASFAALYNKSEDKEALAFSVMRCMAEALFEVMAFGARDGPAKRQ
jgi:hypothetical protein